MSTEPDAAAGSNRGLVPSPAADSSAGSGGEDKPFLRLQDLGAGFKFDAGGTGARAEPAPRTDRWLGYVAQAALIAAIVGVGWFVSEHVSTGRQTAEQAEASAAARVKTAAEQAELRKATVAMAADIRALKTSLDGLKPSNGKGPTPDDLHALERNVDALKGKLDAAKADSATAIAQLGTKVDRAQAEPNAKLHDVVERLERIEKQTAGPTVTGSIPAPAATVTVKPTPLPLPPAKPAAAATPAPESKPQLITGWTVRDVYDGIALLDGRQGALEVIPGDTIPGGGGVVKSIQRRGAGWIVVTSRGLVDSARR